MEKLGQVAALAMVSVLAATVIKKQAPDVALVLTLCGMAAILALIMDFLTPIRQLMDTLTDKAGLSPAVVAPVIKTVGIGLLSRLTAELCRDAKENALAATVEMAGAAMALWVAVPLFEAVLSSILELL